MTGSFLVPGQVRIRFEDLDNIPEILRSISQEEIRELQVLGR